ncbi:MAG: transglycosylase domain-containing protein, partial [Gammaproteobacteria bacterium]|nr:transglycosylase domain-containing protein [Gammaproteobacteria bacterium]MBV1732708.1 transglycosylase domain-containing protein [Hydrogenophaga sp.]
MTEKPFRENDPTVSSGQASEPGRRGRFRLWWLGVAALLLLGTAAAVLLRYEARTSRLQTWALGRYAAPLGFEVAPGPSEHIRFPKHGPFDERLGYTHIPAFVASLQSRGYEVTAQARHSAALLVHLDRGLSAPYAEKAQAGLTVFDCRRAPIHSFSYPHRQFDRLGSVPPVVAQALLFIENRDLLDPDRPHLNPAVDWVRFTRAVLGQIGSRINDGFDTPGGSTLATQIEKFRHSPGGITHNEREKLRQMVSAAVRAYQQGEDTLPVRRQILLDYLNTVPLSAAPRHGEVHGLADGLWVWFGTELDRARFLL